MTEPLHPRPRGRPTTLRQKAVGLPRDARHDAIVLWLLDQQAAITHQAESVLGGELGAPRVVWERAIGPGRGAAGFVDLAFAFGGLFPRWLNFEIKPEIPSLADVIRQINYYRKVLGVRSDGSQTAPENARMAGVSRSPYFTEDNEAGHTELFVVVSPDDRYRTHFESQGIRFLHYPGE